jgi:hypothetical protein
MSSCVLFDIPNALSVQILVEWLRLKHVVRLDSAICSRQLRPVYLSVVYGQCTKFSLLSCYQFGKMEPILTWTIPRRVQLDGICVTDDMDLLSEFLALSGPALRWIWIYGSDSKCQQAAVQLAKWCPNVQKLVITISGSVGNWYDALRALTQAFQQLTVLRLLGSKISKQNLITALSHCISLEDLRIDECEAVPVEVALPTLKSIESASCGWSDAVMTASGRNCAQLETLIMFKPSRFSRYGVTDVGVRAVLQGCPLLRVTDVQNAKDISPELRVELAKRRHKPILRTGDWVGMDDELAQRVMKASPNLTRLMCIERCEWLTDATLAVCAEHCPLLESVVLDRCPLVTDEGVRSLVAAGGARLCDIRLAYCEQLGNQTVLAIAMHCPLLERLTCPSGASDAAVVALAEGCPHLVYVSISESSVEDGGLAVLAARCPQLALLHVRRCPNITMHGVRAVFEHCAGLKTLWLPAHLRDHKLPQFESGNVSVHF